MECRQYQYNKIGLNLEDTINDIYHSEFFIGLSSGLSWLAHAMGKKSRYDIKLLR